MSSCVAVEEGQKIVEAVGQHASEVEGKAEILAQPHLWYTLYLQSQLLRVVIRRFERTSQTRHPHLQLIMLIHLKSNHRSRSPNQCPMTDGPHPQ